MSAEAKAKSIICAMLKKTGGQMATPKVDENRHGELAHDGLKKKQGHSQGPKNRFVKWMA